MKKGLLAIFVSAVLLCGCAGNNNSDKSDSVSSKERSSDTISENKETTPQDFTYVHNNDDTGIVILSYEGNDERVQFPDEIDGLPVVMLGNDTTSSMNMIFTDTDVVAAVKEISLPDSLQFVPDISGFEKLEKINIPGNARSVHSINYCPELKTLSFSDDIKIFGSFINDTSLVSCELPKSLGEINDQMFRSCISLRSLIIPENVTKIGQCAFYDCTGLEEINIPDSVVFIANSAFVNCDDLTVSCSSGSYAQEYCDKKGIRTNITGEASAERSGVDKDNSEMDNGEIRFYYYNDDLSEICLTKYYGKAKDIILEDKMDTDFEDNVKVSAIGQYFIDTDEDVTVYIPDSIITIDEYAFMYPERVTLKGSKVSYAEEYAKTYNMNFIAV